MEKIFFVNGMTCHACEMLIEDALSEEEGVTSVKASNPDQRVTVDFDANEITEERVKTVIRGEGFEVE